MLKNDFFKKGLIIGLAITMAFATPVSSLAYAKSNDKAYSELAEGSIFNYKGSTGHNTNIGTWNKKDYEMSAPDKIITELTIPLNYTNPWYSKNSNDPAKSVKNYYYLGTVIYNDTTTKSTASGYDSLSDAEKQNYSDIKYSYDQKRKTSSAYNAKAEIVKKGIEFDSTDLPLIYQLLTGEKFDWQYWYNEGIEGAKDYSSYKSGATTSTKVSQGVRSDYAKAVKISGYDSKIVNPYYSIINGQASIYVKGLVKGTTTLTVKITTNNNETFSYKVKVTVDDEGKPIKYKKSVNPLSYEGYCMGLDGVAWLSYVTENADFYATETDSIIVTANYKIYKDSHCDTSSYMKEYLQNLGAYEMLENGCSEFEVYSMVMKSINKDRISNQDNGKYKGSKGVMPWLSLEAYLENGYDINCSGRSTIMCGVAECLGLNWFNVTSLDHIEPYIVLDGELYYNNANPLVGVVKLDINVSEHGINNCISSKINYVEIKELASNKYKNKFNYFLYKLNDKYTAGNFELGSGDYININNLGLLESGLGDTRILTVISDYDAAEVPFWDKNSECAVTIQYSVPYVQRAVYSKLAKDSTRQLQLVNSDWNDWSVKSSDNSIVTINSTGKLTMKGKGTAIITLSSKSVKGLAIKVVVSTESISNSTSETKAGTFYNGGSVLPGNYMNK